MKGFIYSITLMLLTMAGLPGHALGTIWEPADTVIIELDNNTRIIIYTKDASGIKDLQNYDINTMLKDLSLSIDSSGSNTQQLVIEDENGERYLSDTTLVLDDSSNQVPDNTPKQVKIKLGTYRISGEVKKTWDEYEEDFEAWEDGPEFRTSTRMEEAPKSFGSFNIELGTNNYFENGDFPDAAPYAVRPWGSWYTSLGWTRTSAVAGPLFIEWGTNFSWYNFKFDNEQITLQKGPDMVEFIALPSEINGKKSKLTVSHINFSFVPLFDFSRGTRKVKSLEGGGLKIENYKQQGFRAGLGVYGGYRLGSHTKVKFQENGNTEKARDHDNYFLANWRYGLRLRIGVNGLDLFANYDLNELFNNERGPELNAFTFGIIF